MKSEAAKTRSIASWRSRPSCWCWALRSASGTRIAGIDGCAWRIGIDESSFIFEFANTAKWPRGIADDNGVLGDIAGDYRPRTHERPLADHDAGQQPRANPRPGVDDRVRTDHTVRADDKRILARPSPLRRLAEHAEILYPGTGADQDVRKRAKVWLAQGSLPWSGARGCEPPPALSVHRSRVDALPGCCRRTR